MKTDPDHVRPFVFEDRGALSMHFDITAIQSRMLRDDPAALALDYTRVMMSCLLLLRPEPSSLLMVGLGGGSLPKYCYRTLPHSDITVVEINPHVIAMRDTFCVPADDERFRVVRDDGAAFVARTESRFDVILVDGFTWEGMAESLGSPAFYADCRSVLAPRGVLVVNLHANGDECELLTDRIADAFGTRPVCVSADGGGNRIVGAASDDVLASWPGKMAAMHAALGVEHRETLEDCLQRVARAIDDPARSESL